MKPYIIKKVERVNMLSGETIENETVTVIGGELMLDGTVLGNDGNVYHQDELETR